MTSVNANGAHLASFTKRVRLLGRLPFLKLSDDPVFDGESRLCDVCDNLGLRVESFVIPKASSEHTQLRRTTRYLGLLNNIRGKIYCPFCRLVVKIADRPLDQRAPSHVEDENPTIYARWVIDGQEDLGHVSARPGEHKYQPRTRRLLIYSEPQTFKDGYLVLFGEDAPSPLYLGRKVESPDLLETSLIRSWIKDCESLHGPECEDSLVHADLLRTHSSTLRAIDVEQMCIVQPPANCRFIALSYLWGKGFSQLFTTSDNLPRLSKPGALTNERLPRTIDDAIRLTRLLGEKYLWTDSLALVHDAGFQYHDDWIYSRAALTVVAGSGQDANAGLPGVRKESRTFHQDIEECKPGLRLMISHLAEDYISTSQWDSRAWTFQERMLSRRCLLFVNGRIYFQCRRTTFCEDIDMPRVNGWSLDSIDMPTRIFGERPFIQFTSAVELFTRRELTNPSDILDAFFGVQQVLEKRIGAPVFFGAWEPMIDASLIWESSKRLTRREGFPSWSWAGWMGEIQWKFTYEVQSWIKWREDTALGRHKLPEQIHSRILPPIPLPSNRRSSRDGGMKLKSTLRFHTISAKFKLTRPSEIHKSVISPLRKRLTGPSALSTVRPAPTDPGLIRTGIADRDGAWCGTIDLDESWMRQMAVSLEFLIMSRVPAFTHDELSGWEGTLPDAVEEILEKPQYGVYNVMLVTCKDGVHYREAVGRILTSALDKALEPGPVWEEIFLG